jgi:ribonuclease HII
MTAHARNRQWFIGIDEAGRGPLAGPVAVGAVLVPVDFDWSSIPGVGDSKKVAPKNREAIFRCAQELKQQGVLDFGVSLNGAALIDRIGISRAVALGIERALKRLNPHDPQKTSVLLDGLLRAPASYAQQQTIIGGDGKELVIGLASILAKVTRDRYMARIALRHPEYAFESHKGYGTKAHCDAIRTYGLSPLHRRTFCTHFTHIQVGPFT